MEQTSQTLEEFMNKNNFIETEFNNKKYIILAEDNIIEKDDALRKFGELEEIGVKINLSQLEKDWGLGAPYWIAPVSNKRTYQEVAAMPDNEIKKYLGEIVSLPENKAKELEHSVLDLCNDRHWCKENKINYNIASEYWDKIKVLEYLNGFKED